MTDRRLLPFSGRVAHVSLRGQIDAPAFSAGEPARIGAMLADLAPDPGARANGNGCTAPPSR
ncbi:hypothetical protein ACTTAM_04420 [Rhodobacter capsulatus]|uniref:hypothetical protein n=1 Tax=Rhodobacter capsulatus TaxID=1061 RepID=UPI004028E304